MPVGLDSADRKLLLGAAAVTLVLVTGTFLIGPANQGLESSVPSSYSSDSGGALAAYLLLADLHYDVRRWSDTPAGLEHLGRDAVLVLAEPSVTPSNQERRWLRGFVQNGGRILFCGSSLRDFFPDVRLARRSGFEWEDFTARIPSYVSRGAHHIVLQPKATWPILGPSQLRLYGDRDEAVVVAWRMGAGEVLWWAAATPLTNAGIRREGNVRLFLNTVSGPTSDKPPTVYWDEYFHGQRASLWSYVEKTPVGWGLLQAGILAAAVLFSRSRRWGPVATPAAVSRLSPLEFVDTLGSLYQSAGAGSIAVDTSYRRLRLQLTRRLGLPASASDSALAEAAGQRLGWNAAEFADCMRRASEVVHLHKMRSADALELVRQLEGFSAQLGVRQFVPEKN